MCGCVYHDFLRLATESLCGCKRPVVYFFDHDLAHSVSLAAESLRGHKHLVMDFITIS